MYFCYFVTIRAWPFIWTTWFPITQWCFMPSLVEIDPVVLKKKIFKVGQCIFAISLLSPLGKGRGPSFEQTWIRITQGCFVPSLAVIGPLVLEKKMKMWKVYRQTDRQTDGQTDGRTDWLRTTGEQKTSLELSAWGAKNDNDRQSHIKEIKKFHVQSETTVLVVKFVPCPSRAVIYRYFDLQIAILDPDCLTRNLF